MTRLPEGVSLSVTILLDDVFPAIDCEDEGAWWKEISSLPNFNTGVVFFRVWATYDLEAETLEELQKEIIGIKSKVQAITEKYTHEKSL